LAVPDLWRLRVTSDLNLSEERRVERAMDELSLSEEQQAIFKAGIAKLRERLWVWRDIANRPAPMELDGAVAKLRKHLAPLCEIARSLSKATEAGPEVTMTKTDKLNVAVCDALCDASLALGHEDAPEFAAEWLSLAAKMEAITWHLHQEMRRLKPKRPGPRPHGVLERLIGADLPSLYTTVLGKKFYPSRNRAATSPGVKFVEWSLFALGEEIPRTETIRSHFLRARERISKHGS
jgi:hypothetical protein